MLTMVTVQEIEQREKQLSEVEGQAKELISKPIPRRRFGVGVTPEEQKQVIKQRQQAQEVLKQVEEQRQEIQRAREQIAQSQSNQQQINSLEYLRRIASRYGKNAVALRKQLNLTKDEAYLVQEIYEGNLNVQRRIEQIKAFQREGLTPVTNQQGQIVGFLDEKRQQSIAIESIPRIAVTSPEDFNRYARAGIIDTSPTIREQVLSQSLPADQRFKPVLSKEIMSYQEVKPSTPERIETFTRQRVESLRAYGGLSALGAGVATPFVETFSFGRRLFSQPIQETGKQVVAGYKELYYDFTSGRLKERISKTAQEEPFYFVGRIAGEVLFFKGSQELAVKAPSLTSSILTRVSPNYLRVSEEILKIGDSTFIKRVIRDVPEVKTLELIPPGSPRLQGIPRETLPPSIKGAFGYSAKEQASYIGSKGVATSQRGLKKLFQDQIRIIEIEKGFGIFGTPAERTGVYSTRISRLGELPRSPTLKELFTGQFSFKRTPSSEIFIFTEETVGRRGGFEIITQKGKAGKRSSELEVITSAPDIAGAPRFIKIIKSLGITTIGKGLGKRTTIYQAELLNDLNSINKNFAKTTKDFLESTDKINDVFVSKTALVGQTSKFKETQIIEFTKRVSLTPKIYRIKLSPPARTPIREATAPRPPMPPTIRINPPPSIRIPDYPPMRPPQRPPVRQPPRPPIKPPVTPPTRIKGPRVKFNTDFDKAFGYKTYVVSRGVKVYLPGITSKQKAIFKGQERAIKTLSATFGVEKTPYKVSVDNVNTKNFYQDLFREFKIRQGKAIKTPDVFIQKRGKRLVTKEERRAIQEARKIFGVKRR